MAQRAAGFTANEWTPLVTFTRSPSELAPAPLSLGRQPLVSNEAADALPPLQKSQAKAAGSTPAIHIEVPAPVDHSQRTYKYLGQAIPACNFDEKWGGFYRSLLMTAFFGPVLNLGSAFFVGFSNGWSPACMAGNITYSIMGLLTLGLLVAAPVTTDYAARTEFLKHIYGGKVQKLYKLLRALLYASMAVYAVSLYLAPPFGQPLLASAVLIAQNFSGFVSLCGCEIPLSNKHAVRMRLGRLLAITGAWVEFGSDFSSGVTAINQGFLGVGVPILCAGVAEFLVAAYVTSAGVIFHGRRMMLAHTLLEVPVITLTFIAIKLQGTPIQQQPAHLFSLVATFFTIATGFAWVLLEKPLAQAVAGLARLRGISEVEPDVVAGCRLPGSPPRPEAPRT